MKINITRKWNINEIENGAKKKEKDEFNAHIFQGKKELY